MRFLSLLFVALTLSPCSPTPPLRPPAYAIPAHAWTEPGRCWASDPFRRTRFWRNFCGLVICDDPGCYFCAGEVYGIEVVDVPIRYKGGK